MGGLLVRTMAAKQSSNRKKIPLRSCVVCKVRVNKRTLTRIVHSAEHGVHIDPTGKANGRGAYLCANQICWEKAIQYNRLSVALKIENLEEKEKQNILAQMPISAEAQNSA